jgi:exodeoxyribonuclease VII large subunit
VTGVGHEIDFTLVDFAADQRAPTPSAAAELVTPDGAALKLDLAALADRLVSAMTDRLAGQRQALDANRRLLERLSPLVGIQSARQRIDELANRLDTHLHHTLARRRDRLEARVRALEAANPTALLARGYAIVTRAGDGRRVASAHDAAEGTWIHIALHDGRLGATVRERQFDAESQD